MRKLAKKKQEAKDPQRLAMEHAVARFREASRGTMRIGTTPNRNDPCPCGNEKDGKRVKFKHCCGKKDAAYRFILIERKLKIPFRVDGKIHVFTSKQKANRALMVVGQEYYVGGMGITSWNAFKEENEDDYEVIS